MAIQFRLEVFEGPLDLLLSLIEKNKIDIYDNEIHLLTDQYMEYIKEAQAQNMELTANFIEMASRLMYIKSCSLLPREEDEEDPKAMLEEMLQQYVKYKQTAAFLKGRYIGNRLFFRETPPTGLPAAFDKDLLPEVSDLQAAYVAALERNERKQPIPVSAFKKLVGTKVISVTSRIVFILKKIFRSGKIKFTGLFSAERSRSEIVATFLAVLELMHTGRIDVTSEDVRNSEIILNRKRP